MMGGSIMVDHYELDHIQQGAMSSAAKAEEAAAATVGSEGGGHSARNRPASSGHHRLANWRRRLGDNVWLLLALSLAAVGLLALIGVPIWWWSGQRAAAEAHGEVEHLRRIVRIVNDASSLKWKAKFNKFGVKAKSYGFKYERNRTAIEEHIELINGYFQSERMKQHLQQLEEFADASLPANFDARRHWSQCPSIGRVPNQGGCGSCFAVAAAGVASDRACIATNGSIQADLSAEDILGCCAVCGNCFGGDPLKALVYWVSQGLVTGGRDGCRPYRFDLECGVPCSPAHFPHNEKRRMCDKSCQSIYYQSNYNDDKHYASLAYSLYPRTMTLDNDGARQSVPTIIGHFNATRTLTPLEIRRLIQKELYLFGPTTMAFPVTEEFLHYASGVFSPFPTTNIDERVIYWHVVRLIGWGTDDDGRHHWLAVNSFGQHWGASGLFRIDTEMLEKYGLEYETAVV